MSQPQPVVRLDEPTRDDLDRCVAANQPAILTGLMNEQVATLRWDLPHLCSRLGARTVKVVEHDQPRLYWDPVTGLPLRSVRFDDFAEATFTRRGPGFAYLQDDVNNIVPLKDDYRLPALMEERRLVRSKFWLSGPGLITPLHYDPVETFHWVIRGRKRFLCYPPGLGRYYPFPFGSRAPFISQVDPDHPEPGKYPRFAGARPLELTIQPGEVLYLPAYWWHQVYSQGAVNISLNFVWFASPWKSLRHFPQFIRTRRHVARGLAQVEAAEQAARAELQAGADGAP